MPDTSTDAKAPSFDDTQSQSDYNAGFAGLIGQSLPSGVDATSQIVQAYFESVELQTRTARRVAEVWATSMILAQTRQAIVADVTRSVLKHLESSGKLPAESRRQ